MERGHSQYAPFPSHDDSLGCHPEQEVEGRVRDKMMIIDQDLAPGLYNVRFHAVESTFRS